MEELEILQTSLALASYPHARVDCPVAPRVDREVSSVGCGLCYCYVCDVEAGNCAVWPQHYRSSGKSRRWRAVKRARRNLGLAFKRFDGDVDRLAADVVAVAEHAAIEGVGVPTFGQLISVEDLDTDEVTDVAAPTETEGDVECETVNNSENLSDKLNSILAGNEKEAVGEAVSYPLTKSEPTDLNHGTANKLSSVHSTPRAEFVSESEDVKPKVEFYAALEPLPNELPTQFQYNHIKPDPVKPDPARPG